MYLIAGLGNPGEEYGDTRHNVGQMVIDHLAAKLQIVFSHTPQGLLASVALAGKQVALVKPMTFVNTSGPAVKAMLKKVNGPAANLIVVHDDLDLEFGAVRVKEGGGSGGHRGLNSIIASLKTDAFARVRVGIGRPPGRMEPADFVLAPFVPKERSEVEIMLVEAAEAALGIVSDGVGPAMNTYNKRKK